MRYYKIYSFFTVLIVCLIPFNYLNAKSNAASIYASNSVLSSGDWYQMKVDSDGVYKLTYDEIKKYISDPSKVKIYGYGGRILDENFSKPYTDDLPEVSVYINKGSDGIFNAGDYLLFYAQGTVKWTFNSKDSVYVHENNPYATYGSYFFTQGDTGPKEMTSIPSAPSADVTLSVFDDYALHERDFITIANTGRELFGENFLQSNQQQFTFSVPGITSDTGKVQLSFAAAPQTNAVVQLSIDNNSLLSLNISAMVASDTYTKARVVEGWGNWTGNKTDPAKVTVAYTAGGAFANLNFIVLNMKRTLQFYSAPFTFFRNKESISKNVSYAINNANASGMVWDITGNYNAQLMQTTLTGSQLSFATQADGTLHEYVMVNPNGTFPSPAIVAGKIANQNLHALPQTDMIILAPTVYLSQAEILAEKHRTQSNLTVQVVEEKQVFNEFSSGTPDATAYRRFMKMFYDRATNDQEKPKYLLLFGDGMFDNRHLTSEAAKFDPKYYLLTYQMQESVNETNSYGSDDYFGLLDDNSGSSFSGKLRLGIGRFPVSTVTQAEDAVNKVTSYMNNTQSGNWKSKLILTADALDRDTPHNFNDSSSSHIYQANSLADYMDQNYPEYILYKYFMDAYQPVKVNGKTTYPDAKKAFLNALNNGCFLLNYTGHGSTTTWSAADMLKITDVRQMTFKNLPIWITATCDFGWFDGIVSSGGEEAFLNAKSGAIALFTTSRVVYSSNNFEINKKLIKYLFTTDQTGNHLCLGDVLRQSKNDLGNGSSYLNYVLLGDPALVLNYPSMKVRIDTINGEVVTGDSKFAFKALEKVTVSGSIVDDSGNKVDGFSGYLGAAIFDGKQNTKSFSTDGSGNYFYFSTYPNMIYQANANVTNGSFEFSFTVPLDISYTVDEPASYTNQNGKMNLYAVSSDNKQDAYGNFSKYILSGTNEMEIDTIGPEITEMYLNTATFQNGDDVNETPYFHARVYDKTGVNISGSGLGHDILISIDNNPAWTYYQSLNNFDIASAGDNDWIIGFSIPELPAGKHVLSFKVWNIVNYSTTDTLYFNVVKGYKPVIVDLSATDNPAKTGTTFVLNHNLPGTSLTMDVRVYDLSGRIVWSGSQTAASASSVCSIDWNLRNSSGSRVQPGVYIYWATVRTESSKEETKAKKIVVLEQ